MRLGLREDKDDCPFMRNSAGFTQGSLQTPPGFPRKVLRIQEGDFRASPSHLLSRGWLRNEFTWIKWLRVLLPEQMLCVSTYPTAERVFSAKI